MLHLDRGVIVVNDAWRRVPWADVLFAADLRWWNARAPRADEFDGERWSIFHPLCEENVQLRGEVRLIDAVDGYGFVRRPPIEIGHFPHSGQEAIALAIAKFKAHHITLVGFDMRADAGRLHFWGNYEHPFIGTSDITFEQMRTSLGIASVALPSDVRIVNATPDSALTCFERLTLEAALDE